jgi:hypothetical protein
MPPHQLLNRVFSFPSLDYLFVAGKSWQGPAAPQLASLRLPSFCNVATINLASREFVSHILIPLFSIAKLAVIHRNTRDTPVQSPGHQ